MHAVVVSFDCLPVAWIGCYGNMSVSTPRLDALAAEAVAFDSCYAADATAGRAATGLSLMEQLCQSGVHCFTECADAWRDARRDETHTLAWVQWARARSGQFENAQQAAAVRDEFAARIHALDSEFGRWLDERPDVLSDDTLLVVTAAAGAVLFPHPNLAKGCPAIIDPIVHVPLIVRAGPSEQCGTRRRGLVSVVDIEATICAWLGIAHRREGHSLLPVLRGETERVRDAVMFRREYVGSGVRTEEFSCLMPAGLPSPGAGSDWDFSQPQRPWLFAKPDDAWDMLDVAAQHPDELERLVRLLVESAYA